MGLHLMPATCVCEWQECVGVQEIARGARLSQVSMSQGVSEHVLVAARVKLACDWACRVRGTNECVC